MATEVLKLTAEIVISHASMSELSPQELVGEIKEVYNVLTSLAGGEVLETLAQEMGEAAEAVKKPAIPLKDIVKEKYVVCLECGKKLKTLKAHIRKAHNLKPKEICAGDSAAGLRSTHRRPATRNIHMKLA